MVARAAPPMKPLRQLPNQRQPRTGRVLRQGRRALIAAAGRGVTAAGLVAAAYPRARLNRWHWRAIRDAAGRYAKPITNPRSRPLRWRAWPSALDHGMRRPRHDATWRGK